MLVYYSHCKRFERFADLRKTADAPVMEALDYNKSVVKP